MENSYTCDMCGKAVKYTETKKLLNKRYCEACISTARSERQNKLRKEKVANENKKKTTTSKTEREARSLQRRQKEAQKFSLDSALEELNELGAQALDLKHNPIRLKRNEYVYFLAGEKDGNAFSISLALTNQRLFSTSAISKKQKNTISLPFSITNKEIFKMAEQKVFLSFDPNSSLSKLQIQQGLNAMSLSRVIAIDIPEHNIDYTVWAVDIHLNQGKNVSYFFKNSKGVHSFYALLSEMVDRINDPIDNTVFSPKRERIPDDVKIAVWRRDNGCCVRCGGRENLEYDHIIPISKGGSNTLRNIELLCEKCNRTKSDKII